MGKVTTLVHTRMTPEQCLQSCIEEGLTNVLVIGYDKDGCVFIRSSHMACKDGLWLAAKAQGMILNGSDEDV